MIGNRVREAMRVARAILRAQVRTILPVGIVTIIGVVLLAVLTGVYAQLIGVTAYSSVVASAANPSTFTLTVAGILAPLLILAIVACLTWAGTVLRTADAVNEHVHASTVSAVWSAFKRTPRAFAVVVVALAAVLAAIVFAPLLVIGGVVGLIANRLQSKRWPSRGTLIAMAIPFGLAVRTVVRWSLALGGVWLRGLKIREALADSSNRAKGRGPEVVIILLLAMAIAFGANELASLVLAPLVGGPYAVLAVQVVAIIVFGGLPFTAIAVLSKDDTNKAEPLAAPTTKKARLAAGVVASLIVPFLIVGAPVVAHAASDAVTLTADSDTTVEGQAVNLTAQVTGNSPTGTVTFDAVPTGGGSDYVIATDLAIDGTGKVTVQEYHIPVGTYGIVAEYSGDGNNPAANSTRLAHTVNYADTTITVTANPAYTSGATTLTATVAAVSPAFISPTGTVTVTGNGHTYGPIALTSIDDLHPATADIPIDVAAMGTRDVTVTYSGDSAYATNHTSFSVPKIPTTMNVFGQLNLAATYGDSQTFEGSVTAADHSIPTGTVDLIWYGNTTAASGQLDANGNFSITTNKLRSSSQHLFFLYEGDSTHASSDNTGTPINLEIDKATSVPVVSISPTNPAIGDQVTVTATLDDLGDGPTGTMTFSDQNSNLLGAGTVSVANGQASTTFTVTSPTTYITSTYNGDINFNAEASSPYRMDATQAAVVVAIPDPGTLTYGQLFDLTATVSVAGGAITPDHGVDFTATGGTVLASNVPVLSGTATISACAGAVADCPDGTVALGASETSITASYAASSTNLLGQSDPYDYAPGKAATTTTLAVDPTNVIYGSGVNLTATVSADGSPLTPTGSVTFYGVDTTHGSPALDFLGSATLVDGVALLTTSDGNGAQQLRWPESAIQAWYSPDGANFKTSIDSQSVTLNRVGVALGVSATPKPAGTLTPITVSLSHDAGASADFTGEVTVTADNGTSCNAFPTSGQRQVTCSILWSTVGDHSVDATYSGDVVYLPGDSGSVTIASTKATPNLGASVASSVVVGTDVTVSWSQFDAAATGTVTVYADGAQWCQVGVQALSCTGQFTNSSATGSPVTVEVFYSGDSNWTSVDTNLHTVVSKCATLDVRPTSALGTVTINTPSTCGSGGYIAGTSVSVTATPIAPAVFTQWLAYNTHTGLLVPVATTATTTFTVTNDDLTWVHEAVFGIPCNAVTASATGYGGIFVTPSSNCTTSSGDPGYSYGTKVAIYPDAHYDPTFGEPDAFRSVGPLPAGATLTHDSSNRPYLSMSIIAPTVVSLAFGPQCRAVTVTLNPSSPGDATNVSTPQNCFSPLGNGYLRGTQVSASVQPGDPTLAISSWSLGGSPDPDLGTTSTPSVLVDQVAPNLTANLVHCYVVNATSDGVTDTKNNQVGEVRVDPAVNCPDGSNRYLAGTQVTLTPVILISGATFNGWDNNQVGGVAPTGGTGDVTQYTRAITINADLTTTAGFFLNSACSRLTIVGDPSLLSFDNTGCGPGYYADLQKQVAANNNVAPSTLWQDKYHSPITANVNRNQPLDVYVSIKSDTRSCFGTTPSTSGPSTTIGQWQTFGPLTDATDTCNVAGNTTIWPQACQTFSTTPVFTVAGDTPGTTYGADSMPNTFYLEGYDGQVQGYSMTGFNWAQMTPIDVDSKGNATYTELGPGPCHDAGNAFPAKTWVSERAVGPSSGFQFSGWVGSTVVGDGHYNPMSQYADGLSRRVTSTALYTVTCHTVTLGEGISVIGDAPYCPGSSPSDNSYIAGAAIEVKAAQHIGNRFLTKFSSGVIAGQIYEDPSTQELTGFAVVDGDKTVSALYQTGGQLVGTGILQGLKFTTGLFAVAAPIVLGMFFPPAGIALSVLAVGAGVLGQIPGAGAGAAVFNMLNPSTITTCAARWAFNNSGDPSGGANLGGAVSLANTMRKANDYADLVNEPVGPVGAAGGPASFGLGLYTAGIGNAQLGPTTVDALADTSTMTNCLSDQWDGGGSNLNH